MRYHLYAGSAVDKGTVALSYETGTLPDDCRFLILTTSKGDFRLTSRTTSPLWAMTAGRTSSSTVETYTYTAVTDQQWYFQKYTLSLSAASNEMLTRQTMLISPSTTALPLTWSSSDSSIAMVSDGLVYARTPGTVTITATASNGVKATFKIKILLNTTIRQSERLPGKDENGNIAADMITNDKTRSELYNMSVILGDLAYLYDQAPASSTVLPPQGPTAVYDKMRALSDYFCVSDSDMKKVVNDMITHFIDGSGTPYRNSILTEKAVNHASTQRFITATKKAFTNYLSIHKGDVNAVLHDANFEKDMIDAGRPHYDTSEDMFNGLKIAINDTWGYKIDLENYYFDGKNYSGIIKYTIYDHFGLDDADVMEDLRKFLKYTNEFGSWYVLQHYSGCDNKHKPFITYIETSVPISGSI